MIYTGLTIVNIIKIITGVCIITDSYRIIQIIYKPMQ